MPECISREAALKYIKSEQCKTCSDIGLCGNCAVLVAVKLLKKVPAADVAPVVRCRDCIYNINGLCFCRRPLGSGVAVEPDDFCRWGETE